MEIFVCRRTLDDEFQGLVDSYHGWQRWDRSHEDKGALETITFHKHRTMESVEVAMTTLKIFSKTN